VSFIDVVFDGPPAHVSGRFVEVEDENGASVSVGEWIDRGNGLWALRIPRPAKHRATAQLPPHPNAYELGQRAGRVLGGLCKAYGYDGPMLGPDDAIAWLEEHRGDRIVVELPKRNDNGDYTGATVYADEVHARGGWLTAESARWHAGGLLAAAAHLESLSDEEKAVLK
jgi:hypothetical protein